MASVIFSKQPFLTALVPATIFSTPLLQPFGWIWEADRMPRFEISFKLTDFVTPDLRIANRC
jgi:hypothetical protein